MEFSRNSHQTKKVSVGFLDIPEASDNVNEVSEKISHVRYKHAQFDFILSEQTFDEKKLKNVPENISIVKKIAYQRIPGGIWIPYIVSLENASETGITDNENEWDYDIIDDVEKRKGLYRWFPLFGHIHLLLSNERICSSCGVLLKSKKGLSDGCQAFPDAKFEDGDFIFRKRKESFIEPPFQALCNKCMESSLELNLITQEYEMSKTLSCSDCSFEEFCSDEFAIVVVLYRDITFEGIQLSLEKELFLSNRMKNYRDVGIVKGGVGSEEKLNIQIHMGVFVTQKRNIEYLGEILSSAVVYVLGVVRGFPVARLISAVGTLFIHKIVGSHYMVKSLKENDDYERLRQKDLFYIKIEPGWKDDVEISTMPENLLANINENNPKENIAKTLRGSKCLSRIPDLRIIKGALESSFGVKLTITISIYGEAGRGIKKSIEDLYKTQFLRLNEFFKINPLHNSENQEHFSNIVSGNGNTSLGFKFDFSTEDLRLLEAIDNYIHSKADYKSISELIAHVFNKIKLYDRIASFFTAVLIDSCKTLSEMCSNFSLNKSVNISDPNSKDGNLRRCIGINNFKFFFRALCPVLISDWFPKINEFRWKIEYLQRKEFIPIIDKPFIEIFKRIHSEFFRDIIYTSKSDYVEKSKIEYHKNYSNIHDIWNLNGFILGYSGSDLYILLNGREKLFIKKYFDNLEGLLGVIENKLYSIRLNSKHCISFLSDNDSGIHTFGKYEDPKVIEVLNIIYYHYLTYLKERFGPVDLSILNENIGVFKESDDSSEKGKYQKKYFGLIAGEDLVGRMVIDWMGDG